MELTQQQKLEILCAYLPYGLTMYGASDTWKLHELGFTDAVLVNQHKQNITFDDLVTNYSPILRHPDDMTEEELTHLGRLLWNDPDLNKNIARENAKDWLKGYLKVSISPQWAVNCIRYLHSIHIDTFGAIEAGWAVRKNN